MSVRRLDLKADDRSVVGRTGSQPARDAGVSRCVFISTCAVHEVILDDRPLDETHPLWPTSHYGAHKAALEKIINNQNETTLKLAVCIDRNTAALTECSFELRRFQEQKIL